MQTKNGELLSVFRRGGKPINSYITNPLIVRTPPEGGNRLDHVGYWFPKVDRLLTMEEGIAASCNICLRLDD